MEFRWHYLISCMVRKNLRAHLRLVLLAVHVHDVLMVMAMVNFVNARNKNESFVN